MTTQWNAASGQSNDEANVLEGLVGNDKLTGGAGADTLLAIPTGQGLTIEARTPDGS
jgi:Ca2+-binding RTX toxin-like protein